MHDVDHSYELTFLIHIYESTDSYLLVLANTHSYGVIYLHYDEITTCADPSSLQLN